MKHFIYSVYVALAALLLAGCSTSRTTTKAPMIGGLTGKAYAEKVIELAPQWATLSGKVSLNLSMDGKKDLKVNGTLRLKRGESIQILITPLLGIEMARMEITPDGILAIDRMGKRYAQASFGEINDMLRTSIGFEILQSLFLNEVFLPGKTNLRTSDANQFLVTQEGEQACMDVKASGTLSYRFFTSTEQGLLQETCIGLPDTPYRLSWKYDEFQNVEQRLFPQQQHMEVKANSGSKTATLDMKLSRLSVGGSWETRSEVSSRYKRIEVTDLINILNSMK